MQISDEMVEKALDAWLASPSDDTIAGIRAAIEAALAAMWMSGDDMYLLDGEVIGFWKSKEPDLVGEFGITEFNGDLWINPEDESDPFRDPDAVMPLPSPPSTNKEDGK